jgi:tetratricopeptide (TPR) repeat protein
MKSSDLVSLAKKVIRGAVGIGLDEAGTRICGPTVWKYAKAMLSPVVGELQRRFPKLLLVPEEAEKASEALSTDKVLQDMLNDGFTGLESGQEEILALLAKQNNTLQAIGNSIDDGFRKAGKQVDAAFNNIATRLEKLELTLEVLSAPREKGRELPQVAAGFTLRQIYDQAFAYQADAMRWVVAGEASPASQRLAEGRSLVEPALIHYPKDAQLLVPLGYIEKTQAQVAQLQGDHENYIVSLEKAAKCFATVLKSDPTNVGALNGMANVYVFHRDYDRAIELGTLATKSAPEYGAAFWDLAIALEGKIKDVGPQKPLVNHLKAVYRQLELLMPQQPAAFTASDLAYVRKRLRNLQST